MKRLRRAVLPATVFIAILGFHFLWLAFFPETSAEQDRWMSVSTESTWLRTYLDSQSYWLGFSYALSLAFASVALRRYREQRFCGARNLAIGGVTLSGFLAVAGCYLLGCCGSPMLAVYASLLGTTFLPFAKPLIAILTTLSVIGAYGWMERKRSRNGSPTPACDDVRCSPAGE